LQFAPNKNIPKDEYCKKYGYFYVKENLSNKSRRTFVTDKGIIWLKNEMYEKIKQEEIKYWKEYYTNHQY
jgi:hypothetical protein